MAPNVVLQKCILVADDDQSVRLALRLLLSVDEHRVIEAHDGAEAVGWLERGRFDLVITDFEMPGIKGHDLAFFIKRYLPSQPILMITAYTERVRGLAHSADAILDKPIHFGNLRKAIAEILS
jgi:DNA-binding response OmpR family regulator